MIYLKKGQELLSNPGMVVYSPTGYYEDGDPILCAPSHSPDEAVCRYEAKYVAYGDNVYNITDQEKLIEEIKKIDPENLFGRDGKAVAEDKISDKIRTVDTAATEENLIDDEPEDIDEPETEPEPEITPEPETEPEVIPEPEVLPDPEVIPEPEVVPEPEIIPIPDISVDPEVIPTEPSVTDEILGFLKKKNKRRKNIS